MTYRVPYSAAQPDSFTSVPASYTGQLLRHVADINELKITLLAFHLLSRSREYPGYVAHQDLVLKAASLLGVDEAATNAGAEAAVQRGVLLVHHFAGKGGVGTVYFANVEADAQAIEQFKRTGASENGSGTVRSSNIFELYERNIGIVTPIIAEELKDAQRTYPAEWIEDAFREAVTAQKQNWKYINRILERWRVEGRGSGAHRSGAVPDDPDKYVKGRYGRVVKR